MAERQEVAVIGLDTGATIVVNSDAVDRDLWFFLHHLSTHPQRPIHPRTGATWIPSTETIYVRMADLDMAPTPSQLRFLTGMHFFLEDLYGHPRFQPRNFYRPGLDRCTTVREQDAIVNSRIFAYFRHTREPPVSAHLRNECVEFVMWYMNMIR